MKYESEGDTNCNWRICNNPQRFCKGTERFGNKRVSRDYPDDSIIKIGRNTEKSPGHLKTLAIIQTPVKNHQLTLKTLKGVKKITKIKKQQKIGNRNEKKTTVWILQETNWRDCIRGDVGLARQWKPDERIWSSLKSSKKQSHNEQLDLTDKMKRSFFQAAVVSILLYGSTTWTLTKRLEKKLDGNYTRMLRAILNKSWGQHPTKYQLYGHLPPITKTIQVRRTRHAGHCWRSRDELISDVLLWIPTYGRAKAGRPARTYIQQLCEDMGCSPEDLLEAINDREKWRERVRDIHASGMTWWWWWWY